MSDNKEGVLRFVYTDRKRDDNDTRIMDQSAEFSDEYTDKEFEEEWSSTMEEEFDWIVHNCWFIEGERQVFKNAKVKNFYLNAEEFEERYGK